VTAAQFHPREILVALARHQVEFVVVGGIAVQAHGAQRVTQDLDIAVPADEDNHQRLAAALVDLDGRVLGPDGSRSATPPSAALLGSGDLWQLESAHGLLDVVQLPAALGPFSAVRARAHDVGLGDILVPVAAREDLIAMKRASGRPQDQADVELLERLDDE